MVLRVLNQILEVPKLGKTPRAHLGPIWPKFGPTKLILVTLRDSYEFWGYLAKILSFKSGNLLYNSNFYLLSEGTVQGLI